MKKKLIFILVGIYSISYTVLFANGIPTKSFSLLNDRDDIWVSFAKCSNSKPIQRVIANTEVPNIRWEWEDKINSWCGWGIEFSNGLDLSLYFNGFLIIVFSGQYSGPAPEVVFLDDSGFRTSLLSLSNYMEDQANKNIVKIIIPIKDFFPKGNKKNTRFNLKNAVTLQFDAAWDSPKGSIIISEISLTKDIPSH